MKRKRHLLSGFTVLLMGVLACGSGFSCSDVARQNPLLRNYFHLSLEGSTARADFYARDYYPPNDPFLEKRVDRLVDRFLAKLAQETQVLRARFEEVQKVRQKMPALGPARRPGESQDRWKESLERLADQARELRGPLEFILVAFEKKTDFEPKASRNGIDPGFQWELEFLDEQIAKIERGIHDLFLAPSNTVTLEELKGDNVLVQLDRVQKMSEALSRQENVRRAQTENY